MEESQFWQLILDASVLVQLVMLILVAASFFSWIVIIQRYFVINSGISALDRFERKFWTGTDINDFYYSIREDRDFQFWQLILDASVLVQLVMLILVAASFFSWIVIIQRYFVINSGISALDRFERKFWTGTDINDFYYSIREDRDFQVGINNVFIDGFEEFHRLNKKKASPTAIMEGVQRRMRVAVNREEETLGRGLSFLASVGSVSPYIGLFGTVWGIMNAFLALSQSSENLTINAVAPGIAEALIATAAGLVAAIPAVLFYNHFSSKADFLLSRYDLFSEEFSGFLHRRLHSSA